jgi:CHAD domain
MPYHLKHNESLPEGIKRVIREETDQATAHLTGKSDSNREARKSVKKIRAALRLVRTELDETFEEENVRLRNMGRALSEIREAGAIIGAFDSVIEQRHKKRLSKQVEDSIRGALLARKAHIEQEKGLTAAPTQNRGVTNRASQGYEVLAAAHGWLCGN